MSARAAAACLALLLLAAPPARAAEKLRLEGISYEANRPAESMAMINGQFLKTGESYAGHIVTEIGADYVVLMPQTGGEPLRLSTWGGEVALEEPALAPDKLTESEQLQERVAAAADQAGVSFSGFNPLGMLNYAQEVKAMGDIRRVYTACAVADNEEQVDARGNFVRPSITFAYLKEHELIPQAMPERTGYYAYVLQRGRRGGIEVHASPVNPNSKLRFLMVDEDGLMHADHGKPATIDSPAP